VQVAILGPLEVRDGSGAPLEVAGGRLRALLIRLVLDAGRPVPAPVLIDAVWGDEPPAEAANALQTLVSRLRRALGRAALITQGPGGYRLGIEDGDVDAPRFEARVAEGTAALRDGDPQRAARILRDALAMWRGPALADAGSFAEAYAAKLDDQRLMATIERIDADLALGNAGDVVGELDALAGEHPLHERLAGLQMRALATAGRQAEALGVYERVRARLADELGVDPSPELQATHVDLLRGRFAPTAPEHRDRGRRTNLRAQLTSFVGRDDDVAGIGKSLELNRLVTLVGPGGAGKTRLASEAAARIVDTAADGVWLVELASLTDPGDLPQTILGSLGIREAHLLDHRAQLTARDATTRLRDMLADKQTLLILDNCEHLLDGCARLADDLLARCPALRILTTSREPLGITGEVLLAVSPLGQPAPGVAPADAMSFPSVRLFADRAAAARPGFEIDEQTAPAAVQIVRRLDGLPLAIELAAARLRTLPLTEIAERLSDRFRLLTGGSRTALPRHRTLQAVVDWSWDLLTAHERLLAERLAVFPAGATRASASAVCADGDVPEADVPDLLASLVDKSLLTPVADGTRLRMLETIREYGTERLAERTELERARARHAEYFAGLLRAAQPHLISADQLPWFELLAAERDNILAAQRYCCDCGDADGALEIGVSLAGFAMLRGAHADVPMLLDDALAVPGGDDVDLRLVGEALHTMNSVMGTAHADGGDRTSAVAALGEMSVKLENVRVDRHPLVGLLRVGLAFFAGDMARADRYADEALASGGAWAAASVLMLRASLAENAGDVATMRTAADSAIAQFRQLGERWGTASTLRAMAMLHILDGELEAAEEAFGEALQLMAELGSRDDEGFIRIRLAELRMRRGDLDGAREQSRLAYAAAEATGSMNELLFGLSVSAAIEREAGNFGEARRLHARALRHSETLGRGNPLYPHALAAVATVSVGFASADGRFDEAHACARGALEAATDSRDNPLIAAVGVALADLAAREGDLAMAVQLLGAAARLRGAEDPTALDVARLTRDLTAALGADGFGAAYGAGRAHSHEDAIALFERFAGGRA
jgi:predicted ATPase/DNA-binding SARP family transcriptional activator